MNSTLALLHLTSIKRRTRTCRSTSNFNDEEANVSHIFPSQHLRCEGSRKTEVEADLTFSGLAPSSEVGEVTGRSRTSCVSQTKPGGGEVMRAMQEKRVPGKS